MVKKIASWSGMLGTALFVCSFTINGLLRSDYNPMQRYISELSIGPQGWIQIGSFMFLGMSIMLFSLGIKSAFPAENASRTATVLFMIIGISYFLSGPFITDPQAMFDNQQTVHGIIHGVLGAIVFTLSAVSCFVLWRRFRVDKNWASLSAFSLIAGIAMSILIVLMKIGQLQTGLLHDWAGAIQRCCLLISYVWIFIVSFKMKSQF